MATTEETAAEAPFLAENAQAMDRMMADMAITPTDDIDRDFVAMMALHRQIPALLHDVTPSTSAGIAALSQEAAASYAVYAPDCVHPVEVRADNRAVLLEWAAQRLKRPVTIPDLAASGYRFMGGRVVATAHGPAAMFMYDDDKGTRLVLLTRAMAARPA
jgi:anti-sigma factor RsiW